MNVERNQESLSQTTSRTKKTTKQNLGPISTNGGSSECYGNFRVKLDRKTNLKQEFTLYFTSSQKAVGAPLPA